MKDQRARARSASLAPFAVTAVEAVVAVADLVVKISLLPKITKMCLTTRLRKFLSLPSILHYCLSI